MRALSLIALLGLGSVGCGDHCTNAIKDADETDVDCGGANCGGCLVGKVCTVASDCASDVCTAGACGPWKFSRLNSEIFQPSCAAFSSCHPSASPSGKLDMKTDPYKAMVNVLPDNAKANLCEDGVKNRLETDVDCGGSNLICHRCGGGKKCTVGKDCASKACDSVTNTCVTPPPQCNDSMKNGSETDVDCGGTMCKVCDFDGACLVDADCVTNKCDAGTKKCVQNQCLDGVKNGAETDVDCGGGTCSACGPGLDLVKLRVKPNDVDNSFLWIKLTLPQETSPRVGGKCTEFCDRMPQSNPPLPEAQLDGVKSWIKNGAPND